MCKIKTLPRSKVHEKCKPCCREENHKNTIGGTVSKSAYFCPKKLQKFHWAIKGIATA